MEAGKEPFAADQDIEITNLPSDSQASATTSLPRVRTRISPERLHRRRLLQLGGTLAISVLCLLLVLRNVPGLGSALITGIFGPAPTPTTAAATGPNINLFYVNATPPWGILSVDGKRVAHPPTPLLSQPLQLTPGQHHFSWQAEPFQPQSCVISVPSRFTDTCQASATSQAPGGQRDWVISFQVSLSTLPSDQQKELIARIQQTLDDLSTSDIVHPGEHFEHISNSGNGSLPIDTAHQPLRGTLRPTLDSNPDGSCMGENNSDLCVQGQDCHLLCAWQGSISSWDVMAVIKSSWTYATLEGKIIATDMADALGGAALREHLLALNISWSGQQWQVQATSTFFGSPIPCASVADTGAISTVFGNSIAQTSNWKYGYSTNSAAGCLLILTLRAAGTPSSTPGTQFIYLHRFGVDLAVNTPARQYNPSMPRPDAYEMRLASQLADQASSDNQ